MPEPTPTTEETIKYGNRNNTADRTTIREIRKLAGQITNHTLSLEPDDTDPQPEAPEVTEIPMRSVESELIAFGDAVKSLDNGHLGGYLVRFSDPKHTDLTGDYFTKDTDFAIMPGAKTAVYFNHRFPISTKDGKEIHIRTRIGEGVLDIDDMGVLIDAILFERDEYEKAFAEQIRKGMMKMALGWSSGTASHLADGEESGEARWITSWPLGLDASITPTPAEPKNSVIPLKSLSANSTAQAVTDTPTNPEPTGTAEAGGMPAPSDGEGKREDIPPIKSLSTEKKTMELTDEKFQEALESAATKAVTQYVESTKTNGNGGVAGVQVIEDEADKAARLNPYKTLGAFLKDVVKATQYPEQTDKRLLAIKQLGMNEGIPSEGGFLVQQDFTNNLIAAAYGTAVLGSRVNRFPVSANSNGQRINTFAEVSRVNGSRLGGMQLYWLAEGGTKLPSHPLLRQVHLDLKKLIGLLYATDENLQDAGFLGSLINTAFQDEFSYVIDDAILNGAGGGQPLGIVPSPATIQVARTGAGTIVHADIVNMWSRMWSRARANAIWVYNQDCEPQLYTMGLAVGMGGVPSFMPPGGLSGAPYATLMGRPAIAMEQCATLGTLGDIVLLDPSLYWAIDKGGLQTASSIHVAFLTDETAFRFVYRFDGAPAWVSALTPASGSANTLSPYVALL